MCSIELCLYQFISLIHLRFHKVYFFNTYKYLQMHMNVFFNLHTLGIWNTTQPNGLAVPDASMHPVRSTADVLELMNIGLMNRAVGATALNERSSRSHRYGCTF